MTGPLYEIGKIRKSHGVHGELKVFIEEKCLADFQKAKFVFIGNAERSIPYFISSQRSGAQIILKLEDVDSREAADALGKAYLFIPEADLSFDPHVQSAEDLDSNEFLVGYQLQDQEGTRIGEIIRIDQYPQQEMLVLNIEDQEKLIPLHESLVVEFDEVKKTIIMSIPEGLLEL